MSANGATTGLPTIRGKRVRQLRTAGSRILMRIIMSLVPMGWLGTATLLAREPAPREEIIAAWQRRSLSVRLEWEPEIDGVNRFQHYHADWIPANDHGSNRQTLDLDPRQLRFEAFRWTVGEHGYDSSKVNASQVIEVFPERKQDLYLAALDSRFADPFAEFRNPRPFVRVFDGTVLQDVWPQHDGAYARGVIRHSLPWGAPPPGMPLTRNVSDELQDLGLMAAILAFHPLHPSIALHPEGFTAATESVLAEGRPCTVLTTSLPHDASHTITIWVDPEQDFSIRRLNADDGRHGQQIDVSYRHDEGSGWVPTEWAVCSFDREHGARMDTAHFRVTELRPRGSVTSEECRVPLASGTWVIDAVASEQYLLLDDGSRREIHTSEFNWLPTFDELRQSQPGMVGELVERNLRWTQYWRSARTPAAVGIAALGFAAALAVRRRRRSRQFMEPRREHSPGIRAAKPVSDFAA